MAKYWTMWMLSGQAAVVAASGSAVASASRDAQLFDSSVKRRCWPSEVRLSLGYLLESLHLFQWTCSNQTFETRNVCVYYSTGNIIIILYNIDYILTIYWLYIDYTVSAHTRTNRSRCRTISSKRYLVGCRRPEAHTAMSTLAVDFTFSPCKWRL